ncbi:MAG: hypothetical protein EBT18_06875 [Gammaproteobacteria bacterium]|nr:hypothetical protein [Gammaproteobacteria bacterium]
MANPLEVIERKLAQQKTELDRAVRDMESLMAEFDCDPVLDVEVFTFTDAVNAKREAAGFSPADRVTYALTNSIEHALRVTGDYHE